MGFSRVPDSEVQAQLALAGRGSPLPFGVPTTATTQCDVTTMVAFQSPLPFGAPTAATWYWLSTQAAGQRSPLPFDVPTAATTRIFTALTHQRRRLHCLSALQPLQPCGRRWSRSFSNRLNCLSAHRPLATNRRSGHQLPDQPVSIAFRRIARWRQLAS